MPLNLKVAKVFACPSTGNEGYVLRSETGVGCIAYKSSIGGALAQEQVITVDTDKWGFGVRKEGGLPILLPVSKLTNSAAAVKELGFKTVVFSDEKKETTKAAAAETAFPFKIGG